MMMLETNEHLLNLQILYVEDDPDTRQEMSSLLKRYVGKVYVAENGTKGLEKFLEYRPEILIVDLLLPDMGGLELIEQVRRRDENCHIIITSTVSEVNAVIDAVDLGIDKYVIKPIKVKEFFEDLQKIAYKIWQKMNSDLPVEGERKRKIEDEIKRLFAAFLKNTTGKGPREVNVFIHDHFVDITAHDALTVMEKSIIDNGSNYAIIEQNRKIFYSVKRKQILDILNETIGRQAEIQQVIVDAECSIDKIIGIITD